MRKRQGLYFDPTLSDLLRYAGCTMYCHLLENPLSTEGAFQEDYSDLGLVWCYRYYFEGGFPF